MDKAIECKPDIQIKKTTDKSVFENININNVLFNGKKQDSEHINFREIKD